MSLALAHQFAKMGDVLPCNLGRYRRLGRYMVDELRRYVNGEPLRYEITRERALTLA